MISRFQSAAARLRGRGVQPSVTTLGGASATYVTVAGFTSRHILFAIAVATAVCVSSAAFALWATGDWIVTASARRVVEAVAQTGVDTTQLSAADLKARLSYKPTDGHILVDAMADGNEALVDDIVSWLRTLDAKRRRPAAATLMTLASVVTTSPTKLPILDIVMRLSDDQAAALLDEGDEIGDFLEDFYKISIDERRLLISAHFPVRPVDATRADLWSLINAPTYPAADLVRPLGDLARTDSGRLEAVRKFVAKAAPLPLCAPVACTPTACSAVNWALDYHCAPDAYLSAQPICVPKPKTSHPTYEAR